MSGPVAVSTVDVFVIVSVRHSYCYPGTSAFVIDLSLKNTQLALLLRSWPEFDQ